MSPASDRASHGRFAGPAADLLADMDAWDRAMVANDPAEIGAFMTDDWVLVGSDGRVMERARFLDLVRSGELSHDMMETHEPWIRLYGDVAVVLARGVSGGHWRGEPFRFDERVSCVFIRSDGRWRCALTHLSDLGATNPSEGGGS